MEVRKIAKPIEYGLPFLALEPDQAGRVQLAESLVVEGVVDDSSPRTCASSSVPRICTGDLGLNVW
ncbi:hypothetical protein AB0M50_27240 [Nonomuraea fuscirosea]|uniref:hypothetical protein n=1 Tax=Nonomuraea fuscirosea TaxID=1291556 RepID=UPI003443AD67